MASDLSGLDLDQLCDAALSIKADHVDVRITATRTAYLTRRDHAAEADIDHCQISLGVRVLHEGAWGFAGTTNLTTAAAAAAANSAAAMAQAMAPAVQQPVVLAPEPQQEGNWTSTYELDPFELTAAQRMSFLEGGCEQLMTAAAVSHVRASAMAVREETVYADTAGSRTRQRRVRVQGEFTGVNIDPAGNFETLRTTAPPAGRGWEYLLGQGARRGSARPWDWQAELAALPDRLAEKAAAPTVRPGTYDLVIDPTNLWLTIHESIGHATELDRVRGYEANYAGTSFATEDKLGSFQYGSPLLNVTGDRLVEHGLATVAWDDEGVAAQDWSLIESGTLVGYQLDRAMAGAAGVRSNGCAYADSGLHVPLQRMPNVTMQPDPAGGSTADLIADVEDGIYVVGDNSWSIDMQRYNFQFTGQRFERIRNGELVGQVKDVAYQGVTPAFWGSLRAVGGPETTLLAGALNCGKGQPGQSAPVSHGAPSAVFSAVNVLNSKEEAGA